MEERDPADPSGSESRRPTGVRLRLFVPAAAALGLVLGFALGRLGRPDERREPALPMPWLDQILGEDEEGRPLPMPWLDQILAEDEEGRAPPDPSPAETPPDAFSIRASVPLRISWPLDVGPGPSGTPCLRARQGVNELQNPGEGKALYAFRVARAGRYRTFLRVRWLDDGIGGIDCNNSWFAALDGGPCAVIGNDNERTDWHWEEGPAAELDAGVHWLRVELREDGVFMDRIAVVPEGSDASPARLEGLLVEEWAGLQGLRPPGDPARPIQQVEISLVPTRSLVIGRGHVTQFIVLGSYQGKSGGFSGKLLIDAFGREDLVDEVPFSCTADSPFTYAAPAVGGALWRERRIHNVKAKVVRTEPGSPGLSGECVFEGTVRFFKPPAWAFLGPFRDPSRGFAGFPLDEDRAFIDALARRAPLDKLFDEAPQGVGWKLVDDASCYDELGAVDLFKVYGRTTDAYCYAVTWLRAEKRLNHRSFLFQADDTASLWMNRRLTAIMTVRLPKEANRLWSSAALGRGLNPVVVKVAQNGRYWGFRLDVVDWHWQGRRGDVIRWAEPADWPEAE